MTANKLTAFSFFIYNNEYYLHKFPFRKAFACKDQWSNLFDGNIDTIDIPYAK